MNRRTFLCGVTFGSLSAPLAAEAQQAPKVPRVGFISAAPLTPRMHLWNAFREGLREFGYVEGQNIVFELRAPEREGDPFDGLMSLVK
jgi:putative ABC transport system substrate-binding protein